MDQQSSRLYFPPTRCGPGPSTGLIGQVDALHAGRQKQETIHRQGSIDNPLEVSTNFRSAYILHTKQQRKNYLQTVSPLSESELCIIDRTTSNFFLPTTHWSWKHANLSPRQVWKNLIQRNLIKDPWKKLRHPCSSKARNLSGLSSNMRNPWIFQFVKISETLAVGKVFIWVIRTDSLIYLSCLEE